LGKARRGLAGRGRLRRGTAWPGMAGYGCTRRGKARLGLAGRGLAGRRHGYARLGWAWPGTAGQGMAGYGFSDRGVLELTSLEQRVQKAPQKLGLPFVPQLPTRTGFLIDYALPSLRVAPEVDGPRHERTRRRDAFRDFRLAREGWRVVRVSYRDIGGAEDLKAILAGRLGVGSVVSLHLGRHHLMGGGFRVSLAPAAPLPRAPTARRGA
jgi:hypothetical protein